jgi:hypothetical protein
MNPSNGKGSAPRKGVDYKKYIENYDKIFKSKKDNKGKRPTQNGA